MKGNGSSTLTTPQQMIAPLAPRRRPPTDDTPCQNEPETTRSPTYTLREAPGGKSEAAITSAAAALVGIDPSPGPNGPQNHAKTCINMHNLLAYLGYTGNHFFIFIKTQACFFSGQSRQVCRRGQRILCFCLYRCTTAVSGGGCLIIAGAQYRRRRRVLKIDFFNK